MLKVDRSAALKQYIHFNERPKYINKFQVNMVKNILLKYFPVCQLYNLYNLKIFQPYN